MLALFHPYFAPPHKCFNTTFSFSQAKKCGFNDWKHWLLTCPEASSATEVILSIPYQYLHLNGTDFTLAHSHVMSGTGRNIDPQTLCLVDFIKTKAYYCRTFNEVLIEKAAQSIQFLLSVGTTKNEGGVEANRTPPFHIAPRQHWELHCWKLLLAFLEGVGQCNWQQALSSVVWEAAQCVNPWWYWGTSNCWLFPWRQRPVSQF